MPTVPSTHILRPPPPFDALTDDELAAQLRREITTMRAEERLEVARFVAELYRARNSSSQSRTS